MSGRNEQLRREIQDSASPLAKHSMNQEKIGLEASGQKRLDNIYHGSKKARKAQARRQENRGVTGNSSAEGEIVFAEDIDFYK